MGGILASTLAAGYAFLGDNRHRITSTGILPSACGGGLFKLSRAPVDWRGLISRKHHFGELNA